MARDCLFRGGAENAFPRDSRGRNARTLGRRWWKGPALRRGPPILLWHGQGLERGLRALAAAYVHLEDLGLAAGGGELEVALHTVDLPEQVRAARTPAAIVDRERCPALEQSADAHLIIRGLGLLSPVPAIVKVFRRRVMVERMNALSPGPRGTWRSIAVFARCSRARPLARRSGLSMKERGQL